jgi:hypothetical protein
MSLLSLNGIVVAHRCQTTRGVMGLSPDNRANKPRREKPNATR